MKLTTIALAGALLCAVATPAASAEGWYLGLGAGWSQLADGDYSASIGVTGDASFGSTVRGSVSGGFKWPMGVRAELEFDYANTTSKARLETVPRFPERAAMLRSPPFWPMWLMTSR
jgi:hypothetical protein